MNAFTCGILSDLILSEFYEQQRLGKVCRSYRIGYVYRFKYFIHIGSSEYQLKVISVQHYNNIVCIAMWSLVIYKSWYNLFNQSYGVNIMPLTPLVITSFMDRHRHIHTLCKQDQFLESRHVQPVSAWFKNQQIWQIEQRFAIHQSLTANYIQNFYLELVLAKYIPYMWYIW